MKMAAPFEAWFVREDSADTLWIEDNGVVCYAYYLVDNRVSGMVWLYNRNPIEINEWSETDRREKLTPLNLSAYVSQARFELPSGPADFSVMWGFRDQVRESAIYIRGTLHAVVGIADHPGWCRLAIRDGPLARAL
jgi:hypothetical protein